MCLHMFDNIGKKYLRNVPIKKKCLDYQIMYQNNRIEKILQIKTVAIEDRLNYHFLKHFWLYY